MMQILHNQPLKDLNTFGLDIRAAHLARPSVPEDLITVLGTENYGQMPLLVLGEGSNILFRNDFNGLVIQPAMKGFEIVEDHNEQVVVKVGASENWDTWVEQSLEKGWYGLENLSLIPGSVGASPIQNIGAYGVELKDHFAWLDAWNLSENKMERLDLQACRFGYRDSIFKNEARGTYVITHVAFRLSKKPQLQLNYGKVKEEFAKAGGRSPSDLRAVICHIRNMKLPDPATHGNAGSFFKNPLVDRTIYNCIRVEYPEVPFFPQEDNQMKVPAAWLIEKAGWKGKRTGNVGTWPSQALVLVNYGEATGRELFDFSEKIIAEVEQLFGVTLEREVHVI